LNYTVTFNKHRTKNAKLGAVAVAIIVTRRAYVLITLYSNNHCRLRCVQSWLHAKSVPQSVLVIGLNTATTVVSPSTTYLQRIDVIGVLGNQLL